MNISQIIINIMVVFMVLGAVDRIIGNKFGLGAQFEEGFKAMGPLALSIVGMTSLAPLLGGILKPTLGWVFSLLGADPAMCSTIFISMDTGGYQLAHSMTNNPEIANLAGIFLGCVMGPTIVVGIPVPLNLIPKEDMPYFALGTLSGVVVIPFSYLIGGLLAGYNPTLVVMNLLPVLIIAVLIAVGLTVIPRQMVKWFSVFARFMVVLITAALAVAIFNELTGIVIVPGMAPLADSFRIVGAIAIVLAGAYPMVTVLTKGLKKPLTNFGKLLGISDIAVAGLIVALANSIPVYGMIKDMDKKGKVLCFAFTICAGCAVGSHLGFVTNMQPGLVMPMVVAKVAGGLMDAVVAGLLYRLQEKKLAAVESGLARAKAM